MRSRVLASLAILFLLQSTRAEPPPFAEGAEVVREMNLARKEPARYADFLAELRGRFQGNILVLPGGTRMRTREGMAAVEEAIRFLRRARPLAPFAPSAGLSLAAAEHVTDQAAGGFGHAGSDRSNPVQRMNHYGNWSGHWGENISYGKASARDIVIALLVDDGLRSRKHRQNIFNSVFRFAGAAVGRHARYGSVCSIDFAAGYAENRRSAPELFARN